ncbi:MAG TPA: SAF domain-containing protein [Mycobacterium sp.]|uniref:SAF domain-containing protein n=1 Tax=Mycolicibacterium sp. TaxID=2320850 RepID=UPI0025DFAEDD|nr:SAF domain-containing protein [Mycolicibacterium sp.]HPX35559.1 SAF domain-containing protein [Mycobacterium sp.]HQC76015.1 SAF domain-containing protein [Mycobacterium sp.]
MDGPVGLNPSALERLSRALRPDFTRTVRARRIAAGLLVLLAAAVALRPDPAGAYRPVAVAARDLSPGIALTADDVRTENRSAATLPDGIQSTDQLIGSTLAGPARRGEVLTDARVLGSRLAGLSAGRDARVVPLRLSDSAVLDVIRAGDVVDVLGATTGAASGGDPHPRVVAANAVVVLVSPNGPASTRGPGDDRVVLVALPAAAATALAGATLVQSVTLTIH